MCLNENKISSRQIPKTHRSKCKTQKIAETQNEILIFKKWNVCFKFIALITTILINFDLFTLTDSFFHFGSFPSIPDMTETCPSAGG